MKKENEKQVDFNKVQNENKEDKVGELLDIAFVMSPPFLFDIKEVNVKDDGDLFGGLLAKIE